jgi:hypothetical protein
MNPLGIRHWAFVQKTNQCPVPNENLIYHQGTKTPRRLFLSCLLGVLVVKNAFTKPSMSWSTTNAQCLFRFLDGFEGRCNR